MTARLHQISREDFNEFTAAFFDAPTGASVIDLIDYPIDLNTHKLAEFALSTTDPKTAISGLLDAFTEIVAMENQS